MRVRIEDAEAFQRIRPIDLAAYLRSQGWREVMTESTASAWEKQADGQLFDLLIPKRPLWRDYPKRIADTLHVLGIVERRSELSILHDILLVSADVVRLRAQSKALSDGSIPLGDATKLAALGRAMMLSAACSAVSPKRAYHTRKPARAVDYVEALKLGQTEHGSFVMTIISPVPPRLRSGQESLPLGSDAEAAEEEPFERRVTRTLASALALTLNAAESGVATGSMKVFEEGIVHGVSADLCESLGSLHDAKAVDSLDVAVSWAPTRIVRHSIPSVTTFSRDVLSVVAEAGRVLRERAPREDFEVVGPVIKVERSGDEVRGRVVVFGVVDDQPRKIGMDLSDDAWNLAHRALDARTLLRCEGDLIKVGRGFSLHAPRRVALVDNDEETTH